MGIKCMGPDCTTALLPETVEDAFAQGWRKTDNYHVSSKLELVWICSDCVGRLISVVTVQMAAAKYDTLEAYERWMRDLQMDYWQRFEETNERLRESMHTIHCTYGEALDQLKSPAAKRAEERDQA